MKHYPDPLAVMANCEAYFRTKEKEKPGPVLTRLSHVKATRLEWLWPGRFPLGKLSLLMGDPSLGKSLLTVDMTARVSRGVPWPDARGETNPAGDVLMLSAEDDPEDTIKPRLMGAGAELERVHLLSTVRRGDGSLTAFSIQDIDALDKAVRALQNVRLIVIDPISAYLGGTDSHKNADVRGLLAPLSRLAQEHRAAIVVVSHLTKNCGGKVIYRATGSLAFIAAARAAWAVVADPADNDRRGFFPVKSNLGAGLRGIGYRVASLEIGHGLDAQPVIAWEDLPLEATADGWLSAEGRDEESTGREAAAEWLADLLADGPVRATSVKESAREAGLSWSTIRRAGDALGVRRIKKGMTDGWYWQLAAPEDAQNPEDAQLNTLSAFGDVERLRENPAGENVA